MSDEDVVVEDDDPVYEDHPVINKNPAFVSNSFSAIGQFLESYGWICLALAILMWYLKGILERKIEKWQEKRAEAEAHRTDSAEVMERQEKLLAARARLQQKYDEYAEQQAELQKQKEEEERQRKLEDWESHLRGGTSKQTKERMAAMGAMGDGGDGGSNRYRPSARRQGRS